MTSVTYPNFPGNNVTYTYGAAAQRGQGTPLVGNVVGRITHIIDGAGTEDRQYGPLGEMVVQTRSIPDPGRPSLDLHDAVDLTTPGTASSRSSIRTGRTARS